MQWIVLVILTGAQNRYEEDPLPDGLNGYYYDNATFEGQPRLQRKDRNIDFLFGGSGPLENIPSHKYSIREPD